MAFFIKKPITFPRIFCIRLRRNCIVSILLLNVVQDFLCSICFIRKNGAARNIDVAQNINSNGRIMYVPTCQLNVNRIAKTIYNSMNLGRLSAAAGSNKLVVLAVYSPFLAPALWGCAFTTVESKDRFSISESWVNVSKMCRKVPSSRHLQNLL